MKKNKAVDNLFNAKERVYNRKTHIFLPTLGIWMKGEVYEQYSGKSFGACDHCQNLVHFFENNTGKIKNSVLPTLEE